MTKFTAAIIQLSDDVPHTNSTSFWEEHPSILMNGNLDEPIE